MNDGHKETPSNLEVLSQLDRVLMNERFKTSATQSKLLHLIVVKALEKAALSDVLLQTMLYENFQAQSNKIRSNASILRGKLADYYDHEGQSDLIRIDLPPGPSYRAEFFYNQSAEAMKLYDQSRTLAKSLSMRGLINARYGLDKAIRLSGSASPAIHLAAAETRLLYAICVPVFWTTVWNVHVLLWRAYDQAERASSASRPAAATLLMAASLFLNYHWKEAEELFEYSKKLDVREAESSLWYAMYLMTVGKRVTALQMAKSKADQNSGSRNYQLAYAFLLYLDRDYAKASRVLENFWEEGIRDESFFWLLMALLHLAKKQSSAAADILESMRQAAVHDRGDALRDYEIESPLFLGLKALCLASAGDQTGTKELPLALMEAPGQNLELALGFIAINDQQKAISSLRDAAEQGHPFINWIHLIPVFDSLRGNSAFEDLCLSISSGTFNTVSQSQRFRTGEVSE